MRLAQALLDEHYNDTETLIKRLANDYRIELAKEASNNEIAWTYGIRFYNLLADKTALPALRILEDWPLPYRDDNRYVWAFDENLFVARARSICRRASARFAAMSTSWKWQ